MPSQTSNVPSLPLVLDEASIKPVVAALGQQKIRYDFEYDDGGACNFWGPPPEPGDQIAVDKQISYFDPNLKCLVRIPKGFVCPRIAIQDTIA